MTIRDKESKRGEGESLGYIRREEEGGGMANVVN